MQDGQGGYFNKTLTLFVWIYRKLVVHLLCNQMRDMKPFNETKVFQILKERWAGKDMETYFIEKNKEFIEKLKKELKK